MENTPNKSINKILEHEGMHVLNQHIPRLLRMLGNELNEEKKSVKSRIWNFASDCCVNAQMKMPESLDVAGQKVYLLFPKKFKLPDGKASEWYYEELLKNNEELLNSIGKCGKSYRFGGCD